MSSLYQLIFKKINNYIINIANADTDAAGEAVRWNAIYINKGSTPKNQQAECEQLGISASDCGRYHGEKKLETLKEIGLFIVPTTKEELALAVVTGGAGRYVIKAGGKIISKVFKGEDEAQKVLEGARRVENNVYRDDDLLSQPKGGQQRVNQYGKNWAVADLRTSIKKFAGNNPIVQHTVSGKTIYKNRDNGIEVVYDKEGDYFRILDPSIKGKRKYLGLDGQVPNNKTLENGKQIGRTQDEYNAVTHFKVKR